MKKKKEKLDIKSLIIQFLKKNTNVNFSKNKIDLENIDFIEKEIIDSIKFLELILFLEKKIGKEIDISKIKNENLTNVKNLAKDISNKFYK